MEITAYNNEKSLQNLTFMQETYLAIQHLLSVEYSYITKTDIEKLSKEQLELLQHQVTYKLSLLHNNPEAYDREAKKYENVLEEKSRNRKWDANHIRIKNFVEDHLDRHRCLPSISEMSSELGISRQTISKHLSDYEIGDYLKEEMQMFNMMFSNLMAILFNKAKEGDMSAIKLSAEILEKRNIGNNTINIKNQQINVMLKELIEKKLSNS